jgi:uncharacterized membrane protein
LAAKISGIGLWQSRVLLAYAYLHPVWVLHWLTKSSMKKLVCMAAAAVTFSSVSACPFCNPEISTRIYNDRFLPNILVMLSAFIVLGLIVFVLARMADKKHSHLTARGSVPTPVPLVTTSLVLGIGIGGFIDGIVLHQMLQWHEMLSARIPPTDYVGKSINMFWDGVFHAFTLLVTFTGIVLLWRLLKRSDADHSGRLLSGGLLAGWGLFNMVEGIIDHHILKLHNVKEISPNPEMWNLAFLGFSVILLLLGWRLIANRTAELYRKR